MARDLGPVCRMCRREGMKLFLKGDRCETAKCPIEKQNRNRPPGMHSWRRGRGSAYSTRLREKQKVKRFYGVLERQFRLYFQKAEKGYGNTGEQLLVLLERRLDNVVFKLNFAVSRRKARQLICHGHIRVNGQRVDIPSYLISQGDKITLSDSDRTKKLVKDYLDSESGASIQSWLQLNASVPEGIVAALPSRDDVQIPVQEQFIVELCSK